MTDVCVFRKMNANGCAHLTKFRASEGTYHFQIIYACVIACGTKEALKKKARNCVCNICHVYSSRLHACLYCVFFGCYFGRHIHEHARLKKHNLAIDLSHGVVLCFACGDYVYDRDLEILARRHKRRAAKLLGLKEQYYAWEPDHVEISLLLRNPRRRRLTQNSYVGLRGLVNLGNTCFMNCILQSLVHTPLLRDYFFADRHICHFQLSASMCIVCEMSKLFQEFYSGKSTPHTPGHLLYLVWTHANHLAGYEQQDAHEFFMAILNILHQHCKGIKGISTTNDSDHCNCIVDQIFTGTSLTAITCQSCNHVSKKVESFVDISLGIGASTHLMPVNSSVGGEVDSSEPISLLDCLERYTRPENLGSSRKCSRCQSSNGSTMQLTIKRLPIVASFHLKRFQHSENLRKKIERWISFPQCLDMTPFISSYRNRTSTDGQSGDNFINGQANSDNRYCLFAVVKHAGTMQGGHYTCYIRKHGDQWFECDDEFITRASIDDVLKSEGYLLFYHKQILEYE